MDLRTGHPFWPWRSGLLADYPSLEDEETADVAIVGAGVTGAMAAYELTAAGVNVVVLDRRDVASGSSAATTGLLMYETDTSLEQLEAAVGEAAGVRAYRAGLEAIDRIEAIAGTLAIDCEFARHPSLVLASSVDDAAALEREHARRLANGFESELLSAADLEARYGIAGGPAARAAALRSTGDAEVDCYRFVHGLLAKARERGARIYDRTRVVNHRPSGSGIVLETDRGARVRAARAVVAGGYEVEPTLDRETGLLKSTWVFISEPLRAEPWPERCLIWETARPYLYLRTTRDNRVLVGGEDEPFSRRHENRRLLRTKTRRLQEKAHERLPGLNLEVAYCWAGVFGTTRDGLPYIGALPEQPHVWYALGYGGNGITFGVCAARIITDAWLGRPNPDAGIFRFDRAERERKNVLGFMRSVLSLPRTR
jgi:glycine/D-amino acid oxidase-like deaminating enzyme